jgi:hypothetical protein
MTSRGSGVVTLWKPLLRHARSTRKLADNHNVDYLPKAAFNGVLVRRGGVEKASPVFFTV